MIKFAFHKYSTRFISHVSKNNFHWSKFLLYPPTHPTHSTHSTLSIIKRMIHKFIGAIDLGTTSTRFVIYNDKLEVKQMHQLEYTQIQPQPGWTEQDPIEVLEKTMICMDECLKQANLNPMQLVAIGITNQRETTIVWDTLTGKPLYNAIVWHDTRTSEIVGDLIEKLKSKDALRKECGLPISTYFSGVKLKWLIENSKNVREAMEKNRLAFGTFDSWLIYNLTGGIEGGVHVTDVTNASRTMMMNIQTLQWDQQLCESIGIPFEKIHFPKIKTCAEIYGYYHYKNAKIPISGCVGDQQAATIGHQCLNPGDAKNTFGTGGFILMNTGKLVQSNHGLISTIGYQFPNQSPVYALEGSIAVAGSGIEWLKNNLNLIEKSSQISELAKQVNDTGGVYFVPSFTGLFAPYWNANVRGTIVGLSLYTKKEHICRAMLEAIAFQTKEVVDAMLLDSNIKLNKLKVDGGMSKSDIAMQLISDILGTNVLKPEESEMTALGAAVCAGLGIGLWKDVQSVPFDGKDFKEFKPTIHEEERNERIKLWKLAVKSACVFQKENL